MSRDTAGSLSKKMIIPPLCGIIEHAEMTDSGVRYYGRTANGSHISVDVTGSEMIITIRGLTIIMIGEFKERSDSRYMIYNKGENTYARLDIGADDSFNLLYEFGD